MTVDGDRLLVYDTFTAAAETALIYRPPDIATIGGTWSTSGYPSLTIRNGRLIPAYQDNYYGSSLAMIDSGAADAVVGVDLWPVTAGTRGGSAVGGIAFRVQDPGNFWFAGTGFGGAWLSLWKVTNYSWIQVVNAPSSACAGCVTVGQPHRLEARFVGPAIEIWSDGVREIQVSDGFNATATVHGLEVSPLWDWLSSYDNFTISENVAAPIDHVVITPPAPFVNQGDLQRFTAVAYDASNHVLAGVLFHWSISDPAAAGVFTPAYYSSTVTLSGIRANLALTATAVGGVKASVPVTVSNSHLLVYDTFTAATETALIYRPPDFATIGGTWSTSGFPSVNVRNGRLIPAYQDNYYGQSLAMINSGAANAVVGVDLWPVAAGTRGGSAVGGVAFRVQDPGNFWFAGTGFGGAWLSLWKVTNYSVMQVVSAPSSACAGCVTPGQPHRLEARFVGPSIEIWWDGVREIQASDAFNANATVHGIELSPLWDWLSSYDNFTISENVSAPIDHVVITPPAPFVNQGDLQHFTAVAYDAANNPQSGVLFHWTLSDPAAASLFAATAYASTVTLSGIRGDLTLTATALGGASKTVPISVDASRVLVYDTFTAAAETALIYRPPDIATIGGTWSTSSFPSLTIRNGRLIPAYQDNYYGQSLAMIDSGAADAVVGVDLWPVTAGTRGGSAVGGIAFRVQDPGNFWFAGTGFGGAWLSLWKVTNYSVIQVMNAQSSACAGCVTVGQPHRLEARFVGPAIEIWWDGVREIQVSDGFNVNATVHGLEVSPLWDWLSSYDNFTIAGVPTVPIVRVDVTPNVSVVPIGQSASFTAQAFDAANNPIPNVLFHWTLSPATVRMTSPAYYSHGATLWGISDHVSVIATPITGPSGSASVAVDTTGTLVYDRFSGDDGTRLAAHVPDIAIAGGRWSTTGAPDVSLQHEQFAHEASDSAYGQTTTLLDSGATDGVVGIDWNAVAAGTRSNAPIGGVVFRWQDANNFWVAGGGFFGSGVSLWKVVAGTWIPVSNTNLSIAVPQSHRLEVKLAGPNIEVWWDGARQIQATDAFSAGASMAGVLTWPYWTGCPRSTTSPSTARCAA